MNTTQILNLISGIIALVASGYILYILKLDFEKKRHLLRIFQLGLFAILVVVAVVQLMKIPISNLVGEIPQSYTNLVSITFILLCLLTIPYFRYNNRKHKINSH